MFGQNSAVSLKNKVHFFFDLRSIYTFLCTHPVIVICYSDQVCLSTVKLDI